MFKSLNFGTLKLVLWSKVRIKFNLDTLLPLNVIAYYSERCFDLAGQDGTNEFE